MEKELSTPVPLEFDGLDADESRVDALQLGRSLQGMGRLYRSVNHFYFTGQMPAKIRKPEVRILVGPPRQGSITYGLWVLIAHGRLVVYPELLADFADLCVPKIVKAIIAKRAGQTRIAEDAMEKIHDMAKTNGELANRFLDYASQVEAGHQERDRTDRDEKSRLLGVIEQLSQRNSSAMIEMVTPVGSSVGQLTHAKGQKDEYVIDEPVADAIRSKGELEVQETTTMKVRLGAVDAISRTCKMLADDVRLPIKGKITDPVLGEPQNVYTHALDTQSEIVVTGKPVLKDGELHTFYISDAQYID